MSEPTKVGRAVELASGGLYDPTGGLDTNPGAFPTVKSTKFGSLMRFLGPALQGGAIGALQGRAYPGGGFQAVEAFDERRRLNNMQMGQFLMNLENSQANIEEKRAQAALALRRHALTRTNQPVKIVDQDPNSPTFGKAVEMAQDPDTGAFSSVIGQVPEAPETFRPLMTNRGAVGVGSRGSVKRLALPAEINESFGGRLPSKFDSGSPRVPGSPAQSPNGIRGIPLEPPTPNRRVSPEDQVFHEDVANGMTAREALADVGDLRRKPDEGDKPLTGQRYNKERVKIQGALDRALAASEQRRRQDITELNKKRDELLPEEYAQQSRQIEEENADRKQEIHQQYADSASAEGIDLGTVPDYRAQLSKNNGGKTGTAARVASPEMLRAYSQKYGMSYEQAIAAAKKAGYQVPNQ